MFIFGNMTRFILILILDKMRKCLFFAVKCFAKEAWKQTLKDGEYMFSLHHVKACWEAGAGFTEVLWSQHWLP